MAAEVEIFICDKHLEKFGKVLNAKRTLKNKYYTV